MQNLGLHVRYLRTYKVLFFKNGAMGRPDTSTSSMMTVVEFLNGAGEIK